MRAMADQFRPCSRRPEGGEGRQVRGCAHGLGDTEPQAESNPNTRPDAHCLGLRPPEEVMAGGGHQRVE